VTEKPYAQDQAEADELYEKYLMPAVINDLNVSIHIGSDPTARMLDRLADIDAIAIHGSELFGIGWRIQKSNFNTFTIRLSRDSGALTQFHKISRALMAGSITPHLTIQAYLCSDTLSYGCASTRHFYKWLEKNLNNGQLVEKKHTSNASFLAVSFEALQGLPWFTWRTHKVNEKGLA
jgi:hypothetical protein